MGLGIKDWASWLDEHFPTYNYTIDELHIIEIH